MSASPVKQICITPGATITSSQYFRQLPPELFEMIVFRPPSDPILTPIAIKRTCKYFYNQISASSPQCLIAAHREHFPFCTTDFPCFKGQDFTSYYWQYLPLLLGYVRPNLREQVLDYVTVSTIAHDIGQDYKTEVKFSVEAVLILLHACKRVCSGTIDHVINTDKLVGYFDPEFTETVEEFEYPGAYPKHTDGIICDTICIHDIWDEYMTIEQVKAWHKHLGNNDIFHKRDAFGRTLLMRYIRSFIDFDGNSIFDDPVYQYIVKHSNTSARDLSGKTALMYLGNVIDDFDIQRIDNDYNLIKRDNKGWTCLYHQPKWINEDNLDYIFYDMLGETELFWLLLRLRMFDKVELLCIHAPNFQEMEIHKPFGPHNKTVAFVLVEMAQEVVSKVLPTANMYPRYSAAYDLVRRRERFPVSFVDRICCDHKGYNPNHQDDEGNTACMLAYKYGNHEIVRSLIVNKQTDWNLKNKQGESLRDIQEAAYKKLREEQ